MFEAEARATLSEEGDAAAAKTTLEVCDYRRGGRVILLLFLREHLETPHHPDFVYGVAQLRPKY